MLTVDLETNYSVDQNNNNSIYAYCLSYIRNIFDVARLVIILALCTVKDVISFVIHSKDGMHGVYFQI